MFSVLAEGEAVSAPVQNLLDLFVLVDGDEAATHETVLQKDAAAVDREQELSQQDLLLGAFFQGWGGVAEGHGGLGDTG